MLEISRYLINFCAALKMELHYYLNDAFDS
jgi:hypothetical protein